MPAEKPGDYEGFLKATGLGAPRNRSPISSTADQALFSHNGFEHFITHVVPEDVPLALAELEAPREWFLEYRHFPCPVTFADGSPIHKALAWALENHGTNQES